MSKKVIAVDDYGNLTSSTDAQHGFQMVNKGARTSLLKQDSQSKKPVRAKSTLKSKMSIANIFDHDEEDEIKNLTDIDKTLSIESFIHEILFPGNYFIHTLLTNFI